MKTLMTYLSRRPSVAPTRPMLVRRWYWRSESEPVSQGIRSARSTTCEARDQILIVTIGRFDRCADVILSGSAALAIGEEMLGWLDVLADDDDRDGSDDAVYSPRITKRIAINARYPY